ncbi:hypothetical protein ANN_15943 [Periplaneta americana]|uniref:Uncharacterized protein n=1 Tax=Periplaneta americana TaxID=6978 RepID=A0ABQ8SHK7_PERAM|nr:hypothetical protein ANN_15943 [Periplaneta americana]
MACFCEGGNEPTREAGRRIFLQPIRNGYLYGCQTWSLTAKLRNSLQICQRKMLRRALGLSLRDRVPNEVLRKMSAIKDPALQATNTKWKWGGHVARLRDGRWTQTVTLWDPRIGKRSRGRPRRRWANLFSGRVGSHWSSRGRHREDWRNLRRKVNCDRNKRTISNSAECELSEQFQA